MQKVCNSLWEEKETQASTNGVPGDLLILVEEEQDPNLIRDENDLIYNLLLSFPTAALGGAVEIPTIEESGKIKLTDEVTISETASSMGGSQIFLEPNETQTVDTLLKGIAVASANDACVAMAEYIGGSVE